MKKRVRIILVLAAVFILIIGVGGYFYGVYYFRRWFCPNTYINDVKVTGREYSVAFDILQTYYDLNDITIRDIDGSAIVMEAENIYLFDENEYIKAANVIITQENPYYWPLYVFNKHVYSFTPNFTVNKEAVDNYLLNSFLSEKKRYNPDNCTEIVYSYYSGFKLLNDTTNLLDWDLTYNEIYKCIQNGTEICDLSTFESYKDVPEEQISEKTLEQWEDLNKIINFNLTYNLCTGQEIKITPAVVSRFICTNSRGGFEYDENGDILIHSDRIHDYIQDMSDKYDTFYHTQYFDATRGDTVAINYSRYTTYGSQIDIDKEAETLEDLIRNSKKRELIREPEYLKKIDRGNYLNSYNGTYVEVDLTAQHMYYYKNGECVLDTDVVTGCKSNGNMTPDCVCYILNKARNVTLIGPGYESFVYYWMCITGQIGIHDATWRSNFGGKIYLYNGSHGCVNTPLKKMSELFEQMEIGTPVFVFR